MTVDQYELLPDSGEKITERHMLDLLLSRYTSIRPGSIADRWVRAEHVRSTNISWRKTRIADFIAADNYGGDYQGSRLALHGHEIKVSRSDWLTELADPAKADAFKRYMHHWWLVVPDAKIVKPGELPEGWGLLALSGSGDKLRAKVAAPRLNPEPLPLDMAITLMGAAARTAHREPHRRDAPLTYTANGTLCGLCGQSYPCAVHQPRETNRRSLRGIGEQPHD